MKNKFIKTVSSIRNLVIKIVNPLNWFAFFKTIVLFGGFFILLVSFLFKKFYSLLERIFIVGKLFILLKGSIGIPIKSVYYKLAALIEKTRITEVRRSYLINLAYSNLMQKRTRSIITIFGMSVGIGVIVLLLSLGYGIEKLIIDKVASLEELKMIDVSTGENTATRINNSLIEKINKLSHIEKVIPIISVVGKITYNKAQTDVLVYAVSQDYLNYSKVKLTKGKLFAAGNQYSFEAGQVAGVSTKIPEGELNQPVSGKIVSFNVKIGQVATAWKDCSVGSEIKGFVPRYEGGYQGYEYWGSEYYPFEEHGQEAKDIARNIFLGKWVKASLPLYNYDEADRIKPKIDSQGKPITETVCVQMKNLSFQNRLIPRISEFGDTVWETGNNQEEAQKPYFKNIAGQVLGESVTASSESASIATDSASVEFNSVNVSTNSAGIEFVELVSSDSGKKKSTNTLNFTNPPSGTAIVSSGMLHLLNIPLNKAIGTPFKISFIIIKSLKPDIEGRAVTTEAEYKISGVVDDPEVTYIYIPLSDMAKIGVENFSQLKVVLKNQDVQPRIRKEIETLGFRTNSTLDTVAQIEELFNNLRLVLALLGMVALAVASLGMFNTLTVSLLERTREIGGMKTMGMISSEVQDLFLAEAMIMGLSGGIGGLLLGYLIGKLISFSISIIALTNGQGYLELTYIPPFLIIFILISSFVVGLITGLYPAQRAKKISALNALRYE